MWRQPFGRRHLTAVAVVLAVFAFAGSALAGTSRGDCAEAVLDDWTRGALGSFYSPECYEEAIDALPEDLRAYTTAADDITRAAIAASRADDTRAAEVASRQLADTPPAEDELRAFPTEVAVLAVVLTALLAAGLSAALLRRRRAR